MALRCGIDTPCSGLSFNVKNITILLLCTCILCLKSGSGHCLLLIKCHFVSVMSICFMYSLWLFQVMMAEFSSCDRDCMSSPKVENIYYLDFSKIICPSTPALDPWEVDIKLPFSLQTCHFCIPQKTTKNY